MILGVFKVDQRFQQIDKRKNVGDVLQNHSIKLELRLVAAKLEAYVSVLSFFTKDEDDLSSSSEKAHALYVKIFDQSKTLSLKKTPTEITFGSSSPFLSDMMSKQKTN